jgi:hypothetical protein
LGARVGPLIEVNVKNLRFRETVLTIAAASLLLGSPAFGAQGLEELRDPAAIQVAEDPEGRRWLEAKEALEADSLSLTDRLRTLLPWADRYSVTIPRPLGSLSNRPGTAPEEPAARTALSALEEAVDDAVRRSVAAKSWKPMGRLADWEAFLAKQGFRPVEERPSLYIVGVSQRVYRRAPKLPQAIHTCILSTREDSPGSVFGLILRYSYAPEVARKIEELEGSPQDYQGALELRLPAFQADRQMLTDFGRQALGEGWPAYGERWTDLVDYFAEPSHVPSRAQVLAKRNPPTISEVRLFGELAANLYEIGPSGRLELSPQANALDLRGNPLYGTRRSGR